MRKIYFLNMVAALVFGVSTISAQITEKPKGKEIKLTKSCQSWCYDEYYVNPAEVYKLENQSSTLIEDEDGSTVYLENPIQGAIEANRPVWIKGTKEANGDLVFQTPQPLYKDSNWGMIYASRMKMTAIGDYTSEDTEPIRFKYNDGTYTLDLPEGDSYILGESCEIEHDGTKWAFFGDYDVTMTISDKQAVAVPESAEFSKWVMTDGQTSQMLQVAIVGDCLYIKGFTTFGNPEAAILGTIKNGKVSFKSAQYVTTQYGWKDIYFVKGKLTNNTMSLSTDDLTFDYDAEKKQLTNADGAFAINDNKEKLNNFVIEIYNEPILYAYNDVPLTPQDPNIVSAQVNYYDTGTLTFTIASNTKDGMMLDQSKLYYNIYYDRDETTPITFEPDAYR